MMDLKKELETLKADHDVKVKSLERDFKIKLEAKDSVIIQLKEQVETLETK